MMRMALCKLDYTMPFCDFAFCLGLHTAVL